MSFEIDRFPTGPALDYDTWRPMALDGSILICSGSGWFSSMIQRATKSVWSHIGILHWDQAAGRLGVVESVEGHGFRVVALSSYLRDYNGTGEPYPGGLAIAHHDDMTPDGAVAGYQWAWPRLGHDYDKEEIAKIAWRIMSGTEGERDSDEIYICSEAGAYMHEAAGCEIAWNTGGFIAPSDYTLDPKVNLVGVLQPKS